MHFFLSLFLELLFDIKTYSPDALKLLLTATLSLNSKRQSCPQLLGVEEVDNLLRLVIPDGSDDKFYDNTKKYIIVLLLVRHKPLPLDQLCNSCKDTTCFFCHR